MAAVVLIDGFMIGSIASTEVIGNSQLIPGSGEPVSKSVISLIYYHGALIHGGLSGVLVGFIRTKKYAPGGKYSLAMMTIVMAVWAVFAGGLV
jgi:hypothetical protein